MPPTRRRPTMWKPESWVRTVHHKQHSSTDGDTQAQTGRRGTPRWKEEEDGEEMFGEGMYGTSRS